MKLEFKSEEEARRKAREDVKQILKSRLDCRSLAAIKAEKKQTRQEVDKEIEFNLKRKVQDLSKAAAKLGEKDAVVAELKKQIDSLKTIYDESCGEFGEISDDVDRLMLAKKNLERVLGQLKDYINIERDVEELQRKMDEPSELFGVYKKLKAMAFVRVSLIEKMQKKKSAKQGLIEE